MIIFNKINELLIYQQVDFDIIEHEAEGCTDIISKIRGNSLQQAAKAMVLQVQNGTEQLQYVLAIVPGDSKVNFKSIARLMGGKKSTFAPPEVAQKLTECQMGAVPPFSFNDKLTLCVDERLCSVGRLYFNAGELNKSISLNADDYFKVVGRHCIAEIATPMIAKV